MRALLRSVSLERALQLAIAATVVLMVLSAGAVLAWIGTARKLRWAALFVLAVLALAYAWKRRAAIRAEGVYVAAVVFLAFGAVSTAWSSFPRLTIGRLVALAVVIVAAAALGVGAAGRSRSIERLLDGVLAGAGAVAAGGLLVLAFDHSRAVQPATSAMAARYQGLGGGPDTATMVLAVGVPIAAHGLLRSRSAARRAAAAAVLLLLLGSIVASDSRGALAAAFAGSFVYAAFAFEGVRRRAIAVAAVAVALVAAVVIARVPQPHAGAPPLPSAVPGQTQLPFVPHPRHTYPVPPPRLEDEIGLPPFGVGETRKKPRTLFGTSGRAQAWQGALELGGERPLLGFGFGMEDHVFVDRYADFHSNTIENSYLGLFLQLGVVGIGIFVALLVLLARRALRSVPRLRIGERRVAAACIGATVAGLVLACFQSYIYAPGNNATAALWICAFLLAAATALPAASDA